MLETDSGKCVTLENKDYRNMTSFYSTSVQVYSDWCTVFEQIVNTRIYVHVYVVLTCINMRGFASSAYGSAPEWLHFFYFKRWIIDSLLWFHRHLKHRWEDRKLINP
jgi:hypothetical protein